jgi:hypothetical protein
MSLPIKKGQQPLWFYEPTPTILSDIFAFPWIPFRLSVDSSEEYEAMGARGSVVKVLSLAILNGLAAVWGLWMIIGGNPYIDLADDLNYPL